MSPVKWYPSTLIFMLQLCVATPKTRALVSATVPAVTVDNWDIMVLCYQCVDVTLIKDLQIVMSSHYSKTLL